MVTGRSVAVRGGARPVSRHRADERRRHRQAAGVHVILHVVLRRVREDHVGRHLADHRPEPPERPRVVEDLEVVAERRMPGGAEPLRRGLRLAAPDPRGSRRRHRGAAEIAGGQIQVVQLPPGVAEQQQRAGHDEFDVVGVGGDGDRAGHSGELTSNPKLQIPSSNHSQLPNPKAKSQRSQSQIQNLGREGLVVWELGFTFGPWELGVVGIWSLELGI